MVTAAPNAAGSLAGASSTSASCANGSSMEPDKERAGLVKLVEDFAALAGAGRTSDAVVKLANLQTKVDQLAAAERISTESAALLTTDTVSARECLSALSG